MYLPSNAYNEDSKLERSRYHYTFICNTNIGQNKFNKKKRVNYGNSLNYINYINFRLREI